MLAPSKLHRPAGGVKTDARVRVAPGDATAVDEFTAVRVPSAADEAAWDLVRVREDARGDLMRDRHWVSKVLSRQGIGWSGGVTWRPAHHVRLGAQRFEDVALQAACDSSLSRRWSWPRIAGPAGSGGRCDGRKLRLVRDGREARAPARDRHRSPRSPWRWRSATGRGSPRRASALISGWCRPSPAAGSRVRKARSPRLATCTPEGCWSSCLGPP